MEILKEEYIENLYHSKVFDFYFKDLKIGILDIETTGLYAEKNHVIIGGLITATSKGIQCVQYFAEKKEEEPLLLQHYVSDLAELDILISYNGDHFDLPFLKKRCLKHGIDFNYSPSQSFDLYRAIHKHSNFRKILPNLKQKTVENFMGLWTERTDTISGKESVELYEKYLKSQNQDIKDFILLHNKDDLLQLSRLISVVKKLDLHKIMFHNGFIHSHKEKKIHVEKIELGKGLLNIRGTHQNINSDYKYYQSCYDAFFSKDSQQFFIRIPVIQEEKITFVDLQEFSMGNYSLLEDYAGYQSGYLVLQDHNATYYGEINHFIQIIIDEMVKDF